VPFILIVLLAMLVFPSSSNSRKLAHGDSPRQGNRRFVSDSAALLDRPRVTAHAFEVALRTVLRSCLAATLLLTVTACGEVAPERFSATSSARDHRAPPPSIAAWSAPVGVVGRVDLHSIMRSTVDHWVTVEAILTHEYTGDRTVPRGIVPDPPGYRACIAYLAARISVGRADKDSVRLQIKSRCAQLRLTLRRHVMGLLILHYWVTEEATRDGVSATHHEVDQATKRVFPAGRQLRVLAAAGVRRADQRLIIEDHLLLEKLQLRLPIFGVLRRSGRESKQKVVEVELAEQRLNAEIASRWGPVTHCRAGYVVVGCD
jgi:hypothetical protein